MPYPYHMLEHGRRPNEWPDLSTLTDDDLETWAANLRTTFTADDELLTAIYDELDRRECDRIDLEDELAACERQWRE